ncbi:ribonuclease HII [Candidatus Woesearchaeota archaeon]|nr:ribonuclease HII [Candidatus Woesearchaeota archaeon]
MLICGIDEAGRGPMIGPLVIAATLIDDKDEKKLIALHVKDSKQLSPKQRESMFDDIKKTVKAYRIVPVSPQEIDEAVESEETNLNWLEADHTVALINELKPDKAILDCPSPNIKAYTTYVKKKLTIKCEIVAEHKADEKYPIVSAASILAKVTRDREIEAIKKRIGQEIGSGYPADPNTKAFVEKNYQKYPEIFRKSWESYKALIRKKGQKRLGEF